MSKKLSLLFCVCFLLLTKLSIAQAPNWLWVEGSGGGNWEYGYGISADPVYNIFMAGRCANTMTLGGLSATAGGGTSPFMEKLDSSGAGEWLMKKTYSGGFDYTEGFYRDDKDNTYSTGIINGSLGGMFVDKYNSAGILQWATTLPEGVSGFGVTADNTGNVYVTGIFTNGSYTFGSTTLTYSGSYNAVFLTQLDSDGNFIWAQSIYGTGAADGNDNGRDIITDNNGNIYLCGDYTGSPVFNTITAPASSGISDFFIAKYDTAGNAKWVTTATNSFAGTFGGSNGLTIDPCGNLYATGGFANTAQFGNISVTSIGGNDIFVTQCNNNGQWQWVQRSGGTGNDAGFAITLDKNNYVYAAGDFSNSFATFGSINLTSGNVFVAKYANSNGALQWVQGATASGGIQGITVDNSNYVYATGGFRYTARFGKDSVVATSTENIFIAKLDTIANRTITGVFDSVYCPGLYEPQSYTITGTFNTGNVFTAQLSDSTGSFVSAVTIGSTTATTGGIINVKIPNSTPIGSHYHIRIVSSNPATSSSVSCNTYVSIGQSLQFILFGDTTICKGSSANLSVSGGSTYLWSTGDTTATIGVAPLKDSTYTVAVGNGVCTKDTFITVTVSTPPGLTIQPQSLTICDGNSIVFTGSGSPTYNWSNGDTTSSITLYPTKDTTYNISVSNGICSTDTLVTITVINVPVPDIQPSIPVICNGGSIELTASGGSSYLWNTGDTTATITVSPLKDSTYTVSVSNGNGLCSKDTFVRVIVSTPPVITIQPQSLTICNGGGIIFTASGSTSYSWNNGDTTSSITINPTKDTTYTISVSNGFCIADTLVTVTVISMPKPSIQPSSPVICLGWSIELKASGGSSYLWSTGDSTATITVAPVKDSTFTVAVSNGNGLCSKDTFVTVIIDTPPALIFQPQSPTICNSQSITLSVTNEESGFAWSPSTGLSSTSTDSTIASPTATTTYTLSCLDSIGCSSSGTVVVTVDSCSVVWPGDANDDSIANNYDLIPIGIYYGDTGIARDSISNSWLPHLAADWSSIQYNGLNKKYVDCNGDGIINSDDTLAIYLNYGLTHNLPMKGFSPDTIHEVVPFYFIADSSSYYPGSPVQISVWLGIETEQATKLYALGYDIGLNSSLLQPGTLAFNYANSFIGTKNSDVLTLTHLNNDVETAVARINHNNTTGYGKIGNLYFTLSPSITATQYVVSFTSYEAVDSAGNPIIFQPKDDTLIINQPSGINQLSMTNEQISVYPNPASNQLTITSYQLSIDKIEIKNVLGQAVFESTFTDTEKSASGVKHTIDISNLPAGTYFIAITSNNETVTRKIVVVK